MWAVFGLQVLIDVSKNFKGKHLWLEPTQMKDGGRFLKSVSASNSEWLFCPSAGQDEESQSLERRRQLLLGRGGPLAAEGSLYPELHLKNREPPPSPSPLSPNPPLITCKPLWAAMSGLLIAQWGTVLIWVVFLFFFSFHRQPAGEVTVSGGFTHVRDKWFGLIAHR